MDEPRVLAANRVCFTGPVPMLNRFRPQELRPPGAQPASGVGRGPLRLMPSFAANHLRAGVIKPRFSLSFLRDFQADLDKRDFSIRRKRGAAIADTKRSGAAAYPVHTTVVTRFSDAVSFPTLAATGWRYYARRAANHQKGLTRSAPRLDFRPFSRDTARQRPALAANEGRRSTQ